MNHLGRTNCCDHVFSAKDIQGRIMGQKEAFGTFDPNLYGGNVTAFANTECPECHTKYLLWMRQSHQSYAIVTISKIGEDDESEESQEDKPKCTYNRRT